MVSAFFYCYFLSMNMEKLYKKLIDNDNLKDIPIETICKVVVCVFEIINSGDCFYKEDDYGIHTYKS